MQLPCLQRVVLVLQGVHVLGLCCQGIYGLLHLHKLLFPSLPCETDFHQK